MALVRVDDRQSFDDSGYYAMVKGRDIIFRLPTEWVHLCMKNLRKLELFSDGE